VIMKPVLVPAGLAVSLLGAVASIAFGAPIPVRLVAVLVTLVLLPGMAVSFRIGTHGVGTDRSNSATPLALATGIAWLVLATEVLLYAHWWKPGAMIPASTAFAAIVMAVPSTKGAHIRRRSARTRFWIGCGTAVACWFVALQAWSIYRAPFRVEELWPVQGAWVRAGGTSVRPARVSSSAISLLFEAVIPFQRSSFGTLLAARWLALGLFLIALGSAAAWCRSLVRGRTLAFVLVAMVGSSAFFHADRLSGVTAVSTPLILASGVCLAGESRMRRRFLLAGGLVGLAAVSSRTGLGAAIGLGSWAYLDTRSSPPIQGVARTRVGAFAAGLLGTLIAVVICARIFVLPIPVMNHLSASTGTGRFRMLSLCGALALFALGAFVSDIATSWSGTTPRLRIRKHHAPLLALVGACIGASMEGVPLLQVAPPALLLSILGVTGLLASPDSGIARTARRRPARNAVDGGPVGTRLAPTRLAGLGFAAVMLVLGGVQTARVLKLSNQLQTRQMAYILERTTPGDAVYDPSRAVGVLRPQVDRKAIDQAAFAVVSEADIARDRVLEATLDAAGFTRAPLPGVWVAVLQWSSSLPVHVSPARTVTDLPGNTLDWTRPVKVPAEARTSETERRL
jgi:hypothetical protein